VVFPPGSTSRERNLLRVQLWWPYAGMVSALLIIGFLGPRVGAPAAVLLGLALFTAVHVWLRHALRRQRPQLCIVHAEYLIGPGTPADLARCQQLLTFGSQLTAAEQALDRGELSPVDFEMLWCAVHAEARSLTRQLTG
jgi:hypothetical protein